MQWVTGCMQTTENETTPIIYLLNLNLNCCICPQRLWVLYIFWFAAVSHFLKSGISHLTSLCSFCQNLKNSRVSSSCGSKSHRSADGCVSELLRAVNLISFSRLISIRRVKPLRVLLRSLAPWKIALCFLLPSCLPFYTLGVSLGSAGPGREKVCWKTTYRHFKTLLFLHFSLF